MYNTSRLRALFGALLMGGFAALSVPAHAANDAMLDLLKILKDKGSITQQEYETLVFAAKADGEAVEDSANQIKLMNKTLPKVETKDKISIASQDGDFKWTPIGRVMADYIFTNSDETELENGAELRRARLGMEAVLWKHWEGKVEVDFGEDEVSVKDAYVGYASDWSGGKWWIKAGQHHIPFGLSTISSSKVMTFMNRPMYADGEMQPARQMGVAGFMNSARWTAQVGAFAGGLEEPTDCQNFISDTETGECDQEVVVAARATGAPFLRDPAHLLHIGAGVLYKNPNGGTIDIDQRDGIIHIINSKNLNADFTRFADDAWAFNVETVGVYGPAHFMAEYVNWDVSRQDPALDDVTLQAWSADVGFFLTGESKNMDIAKAQYGSIKPKGIVGKGGIGAWEVALRYEEADYNDFDAGFIGGEAHLLTVGLNWYVNNTMRFMANYVDVLSHEEAGGGDEDDEPSAFMLRGQIYW